MSVKRNAKSNGANLGFMERIWQAADKLRSDMDAAENKHVVLRLILLTNPSDPFQVHHQQLDLRTSDLSSE